MDVRPGNGHGEGGSRSIELDASPMGGVSHLKLDLILFKPISRYQFAPEQDEFGTIDLSQPEIPFYMNLYSGELSLEMPKMARSSRGGILA